MNPNEAVRIEEHEKIRDLQLEVKLIKVILRNLRERIEDLEDREE